MKQKRNLPLFIASIISFCGSIMFLCAMIYSLFASINEPKRTEDYLVAIAIILVTTCSALYALKTNFAGVVTNELEKTEHQNMILKKKIEQVKLITELDKTTQR